LTCQPLRILDIAFAVLSSRIYACRRRSQVPFHTLVRISVATHVRSEGRLAMSPMLRLKCVWVYPRIRLTGEAFGCNPSSLVDRNPAATIWLMPVDGSDRFSLVQMRFCAQPNMQAKSCAKAEAAMLLESTANHQSFHAILSICVSSVVRISHARLNMLLSACMHAPWEPCPGRRIPKILKHLHRNCDSGESLYADGWSVAARLLAAMIAYEQLPNSIPVPGSFYNVTNNRFRIDNRVAEACQTIDRETLLFVRTSTLICPEPWVQLYIVWSGQSKASVQTTREFVVRAQARASSILNHNSISNSVLPLNNGCSAFEPTTPLAQLVAFGSFPPGRSSLDTRSSWHDTSCSSNNHSSRSNLAHPKTSYWIPMPLTGVLLG
ncbi:hypothetical protein KCU65_g181, partial [Aureobasidium melanogenum]